MIRSTGTQQLDGYSFSPTVGLGDLGAISLVVDPQPRGSERGEGDLVAAIGDLDSEGEVLGE